MTRFRSFTGARALAVAVLLSGAVSAVATGLPARAAPVPAGGGTSTTLLNVNFGGGFNGTSYQPGKGETVSGSLTRDTGSEAASGGAVGLAGGSQGLTFTPSASLTADGAVTSSLSVEMLAKSVPDGNGNLDTLISIGGGAWYRYASGLTGANEYGEDGTASAGNPTVSGAARAASDTGYDHIQLVYTYVSPTESDVSISVDGCAVGNKLVDQSPANAAVNAIGFGNEVNPAATNRGFTGSLKAVAVTRFTGDTPPPPVLPSPSVKPASGTVQPANVIPVGACDSPQAVRAKAASVVPSANQLAWQQANGPVGFVHFGPNTFTGAEIGTGTEPVTTFAPTNLNTDQWAQTFKSAGIKEVLLVVKHHDGFVLFPSRYTTYSVKFDTAWDNGHGDLVRQFVDSMHKYGLKVGFYLSPADLHEAQSGGVYANGSAPRPVTIPTLVSGDDRTAAVQSGKLPSFHFTLDDYNTYFLNQMYELLTQYGPVDEVWLDGANPTSRSEPYNWEDWYQLIRTLQPHAVVFNGQDVRWVGNESSVARTSEWSTLPFAGDPATTRYNHELNVEWTADLGGGDQLTNAANYLSWFPAECDARIESGWFWHPGNGPKSLAALQSMYDTSVGRNCQFLLDIPPDTTGQIDSADAGRAAELGNWITQTFGDANDAAIGSFASATSGERTAANVADGNPDTSWQPAGDTGSVTLTLPNTACVDNVVLKESIASGQEAESFTVDGLVGGAWQQIAAGTTIGAERILPLSAPAKASALRLTITGARATPSIATFGATKTSASC